MIMKIFTILKYVLALEGQNRALSEIPQKTGNKKRLSKN